MKHMLLLLAIMPLLISCSSADELVIETQMCYLARENTRWNDAITATFCFFKDGNYDPTTFEYSDYPWQPASLKTTSGETVSSFFIDIVSKNDKRGYGSFILKKNWIAI